MFSLKSLTRQKEHRLLFRQAFGCIFTQKWQQDRNGQWYTCTHTSFVTKPLFPPCVSLLLTCPITPLRPWTLRGAAHLPPSAQRTQMKDLPQPVTILHLKQMSKGLAQHPTSCFGARAFVTDSWIALPQLCKAGVWGWGRGRLLSGAGRQKFRAALCQEFFDFAT